VLVLSVAVLSKTWKKRSIISVEKFAGFIESHWEGIISYCHPDHKFSLGFMEGLNNKIRVIQRRAYGINDKEYLMLKVVASFIKEQK
jgi:transposase